MVNSVHERDTKSSASSASNNERPYTTSNMPPFPEISVTESERRFYNGIASAILRKAVAEYTRCKNSIDGSRWRHVRSRKQLSVFRSSSDHGDDSSTLRVLIGSGTIDGTLEEVMDGLYADSTADLRCVSMLLGHKLVDGAVLNVTTRRTPADPFQFEGIKWRAAKAPWGMSTHRDILTYERVGTIVDKRGIEVVYHVIQSIDRPEWPANAIKGLKREQTCMCYLYRRSNDTQDGRVQCFIWGELVDLSAVTQRAAEYVIAGNWLNVVRSVDSACAKRRSALIAACDRSSNRPWQQLVGSTCRVCYRRESKFAAKTEVKRMSCPFSFVECTGCRQTTCKRCSSLEPLFALNEVTRELEQLRFCKLCLGKVRLRSSDPQTLSPSTMLSFEVTPPLRQPSRNRWDSAPASLGFAASPASAIPRTPSPPFVYAVSRAIAVPRPPLSPPQFALSPQRKLSQRVRYNLLEPSSRTASAPMRTLSNPVTPSPLHWKSENDNAMLAKHHDCKRHAHKDTPRVDSGVQTTLSSSTESDSSSSSSEWSKYLPAAASKLTMNEIVRRHTDVLDEFDLDIDVRLHSDAGDVGTIASNTDALDRTYHELVFAWRNDSDNVDTERFLDDLYPTATA